MMIMSIHDDGSDVDGDSDDDDADEYDQIRRVDTRLRWLKPVAAKRSTGYSAAPASFKTHHH